MGAGNIRRRPSRSKRFLAGAVIAVLALLGALAVAGELPRWRPGGSAVADGEALPDVPLEDTPVRSDMRIVVEGDSHVLGQRLQRSAADSNPAAFPAVLAASLGLRQFVDTRGIAGATAGAGLETWREVRRDGRADLAIIVYGHNDAAPRGWLSRKRPVGLDAYKSALGEIVRQYRGRGARVVVLGPLAGGSRAIARRLSPYREAARAVAIEERAAYLDPRGALARCGGDEPLLQYDATHLNARGHACIGEWLAAKIRSASRAPSARSASDAD